MPSKRLREDDDEPAPPTKKARTDGKVGILSANTCGLNRGKLGKLVAMADTHGLDMILVQEGSPDVAKMLPDGWQAFVTHEAPTQAQLTLERGVVAAPTAGVNRYYNALVRKGSGLKVRTRPYAPQKVPAIVDRIRPQQAASRSGRARKAPVDQTKLRLLGLRGPQVLEVTQAGFQSVTLFNYHAPQGSGSAVGFSGMDAPLGHEVMQEVMAADPNPLHALVGDQNAEPQSLDRLYPRHTRISAGRKDRLSHAVVTPGLAPMQVDLQGAGDAFNSKGSADCSDHSAFALVLQAPPGL